ncbi:AraC family transcriptional regulator [Pseudonocardia xinjiangensis]|uniref:helix-turn-helix transcriptional regulator n=1 Tax=Pseudonocardia xinjiangensis TaxID=75289 RepID=UPI003D8D4FBB
MTTAPAGRPDRVPHGDGPFLPGHVRLRTTDPEAAQRETARLLTPHRLRNYGERSEFDARVEMVELGAVSLLEMRFGAEISIERAARSRHIGVLIPVAGAFTARHRQVEFTCTPQGAMAVLSPGEAFHMRWSRGCTVLSLRVAADALRVGLGRLGHDAGPAPLKFEPCVADPTAVQAVRGVTQLLAAVVGSYPSLERIPRTLLHRLCEQAVSTVLIALPHDRSLALFQEDSPIGGRAVREAVDLVMRESEARHTVSGLARQVGVTVRALELGFRRELGCTPTSYLQRHRIQRAHDELADAVPGSGVTVMEVAMRWGFGNAGRFATSYRKEFGTTPSVTLRRQPLTDSSAASGGDARCG